ncbi:hypothetical protein B0H63DRAFT_296903 [Podospora didyma]|uniref:Uncharacterized protein n=1 Tax=Podospora didyma TaxID=330526 RepID=A0AAE0KAI5_9PEZI|nr:hypothetical protein B0H63DRAFT_296903 [Podospora didyma]
MAPTVWMAAMVKREDGCGYNKHRENGVCRDDYYSGWYWWGRWVFAGLAVIFVIALLLLLGYVVKNTIATRCGFVSLISSSRRNSRIRRQRGLPPRYGTGWMAPGPAPPYYPPGPPPPQYSAQGPVHPQQTGHKFNQNDGYYGNQQEGIQLQEPSNTYQRGTGGDNVYAPPEGPPPARGGDNVYAPPEGPPPGKRN